MVAREQADAVAQDAVVEERRSLVQDDDVDPILPEGGRERRRELRRVPVRRLPYTAGVDENGDIDVALRVAVSARERAEQVGVEYLRSLEEGSLEARLQELSVHADIIRRSPRRGKDPSRARLDCVRPRRVRPSEHSPEADHRVEGGFSASDRDAARGAILLESAAQRVQRLVRHGASVHAHEFVALGDARFGGR